MPDKPSSNRPDYTLISKAWSIGLAIVLLTLIGHWLDQKFHTSVIFTIAGACLGIFYSLYEAFRALK